MRGPLTTCCSCGVFRTCAGCVGWFVCWLVGLFGICTDSNGCNVRCATCVPGGRVHTTTSPIAGSSRAGPELVSQGTAHTSRFPLHASRFPLHASHFPLHASRFPLHASRFTLPTSRFCLANQPVLNLAPPFQNGAKTRDLRHIFAGTECKTRLESRI